MKVQAIPRNIVVQQTTEALAQMLTDNIADTFILESNTSANEQ